jgi:hypothetical protein
MENQQSPIVAFFEDITKLHQKREQERREKAQREHDEKMEAEKATREAFQYKLKSIGLDVTPVSDYVKVGVLTFTIGGTAGKSAEWLRMYPDAVQLILTFEGRNRFVDGIESLVTSLEELGYFGGGLPPGNLD